MDYPQAFVSIVMLFIFVVIGLPLWWNTTKVYRADLPHHEIKILEKSTNILNIMIKIHIEAESQSLIDTRLLAVKLNQLFPNFQFDLDVLNIQLDKQQRMLDYCSVADQDVNNDQLAFYFLLVKDSSFVKNTKNYCQVGLKTIISLPDDSTSDSLVELLVAHAREILPVDELIALQFSEVKKSSKSAKHTLPPSGGYRLTFNLAVADSMDYLPTWNIQEAINEHLQPLLRDLEFMGPFHISSQILYFADVHMKPNKDSDVYYFSKAKLPLFINPLESRLSTYTSTDANLNFIVYIPQKKYSPLVIKTKKSSSQHYTAFHSPRWGGIQFYTPTNESFVNGKFTVPMGNLMQVFIYQFRKLIGIDMSHLENTVTEKRFSDLVRMKLLVYKTFEHLKECIATLSSLSKLLDEIANIVIRDDIKKLIEESVYNVQLSSLALQSGDIQHAYKHSKMAYVASEKAFYDSSLLTLLYFPDDQKYAIYVPLFLPIALPVLLSFFKAVKWLRSPSIVDEKVKSD